MGILIPTPETFAAWLLFAMGLNFGRAFGKSLDKEIQTTDWFKKQDKFAQWIIERLLDATHHWWIGGLLMLSSNLYLYWFGVGLLVDDLPDIPRRAAEIFQELKK